MISVYWGLQTVPKRQDGASDIPRLTICHLRLLCHGSSNASFSSGLSRLNERRQLCIHRAPIFPSLVALINMPTETPSPPLTAVHRISSSTVPTTRQSRESLFDEVTSPLLPVTSPLLGRPDGFEDGQARWARWRRPLGLTLLFVTVILWTASNFLASV